MSDKKTSGEELLNQVAQNADQDQEEGGSCCGCCGGQAG